MSAPQANEAEKNIEIWKVKKLIKRLEAARGNGTSMISLIIRVSLETHRCSLRISDMALQHPRIKSPGQPKCWLKNLCVQSEERLVKARC